MRVKLTAAAGLAVMVLAACGSGGSGGSSDKGSPPSSSFSGNLPGGTVTATGGPTATPSATGQSDDRNGSWISDADAVCSQAIQAYQQAKSRIGTDEPESLTLAAAQILNTAADAIEAMPGSTIGDRGRLTRVVRDYALKESAWAASMEGTSAEESQAYEDLSASGEQLAATASHLGAPSCAAMSDRI